MIISCPQCKAQYKLASLIKNAILVCHRCGTEFNPNATESSEKTSDLTPSLFEHQHSKTLQDEQHTQTSPEEVSSKAIEPTAPETTDIQKETPYSNTDDEMIAPSAHEAAPEIEHEPVHLDEHMLMPKRPHSRVWPWMMLVLLAIAGFGIWKNQNQWLENIWVRSLMLQINMPIQSSANDWMVVQQDIQNQWVERQDHSRVLVVHGYIQNRLHAAQLVPDLKVSFFDIPETEPISSRILAITEPPSLPQIRHAPYIAPPKDMIPVQSGGKRIFTLVIEDVPKDTRNISISIARKASNTGF